MDALPVLVMVYEYVITCPIAVKNRGLAVLTIIAEIVPHRVRRHGKDSTQSQLLRKHLLHCRLRLSQSSLELELRRLLQPLLRLEHFERLDLLDLLERSEHSERLERLEWLTLVKHSERRLLRLQFPHPHCCGHELHRC